MDEINECTYDPPGVRNGTKPTFLEGATVKTLVAERQSAEATAEYDDQAAETSKLCNYGTRLKEIYDYRTFSIINSGFCFF